MKKTIFIILVLFSSLHLFSDEVLELKGVYIGENLYVMNPSLPNGKDFCVSKVSVNGQPVMGQINSNVFEIDFSVLRLEIGEKINIVITHKIGCMPQVINPKALVPESTFLIASISISDDETLKWTTTDEVGTLDFYIEQYKWNKWVRVATVKGKGIPERTDYSVKLHFITGLNRFRISQIDYTKSPRRSQIVEYKNITSGVEFSPGNGKKVKNEIVFSKSTHYEILDYFGNLKLDGFGEKIDLSGFDEGTYYLNYDNKSEIIEKK